VAERDAKMLQLALDKESQISMGRGLMTNSQDPIERQLQTFVMLLSPKVRENFLAVLYPKKEPL